MASHENECLTFSIQGTESAIAVKQSSSCPRAAAVPGEPRAVNFAPLMV